MSGGRPSPRYPTGTVRALLATTHVSAATRRALEARLAAGGAAPPRYFTAVEYETLRAVLARLVPQGAPDEWRVDLAAAIDERLADGRGDGWRYDAMPPDGDAHRCGLAALDATARRAGGRGFADADAVAQDAILHAVQAGTVTDAAWGTMPSSRYFEELLTEAVETYYSHPLTQEEIGYVGMADLPGWSALGLDVLEPREPRRLPIDA